MTDESRRVTLRSTRTFAKPRHVIVALLGILVTNTVASQDSVQHGG
jgi:hypothetical protein